MTYFNPKTDTDKIDAAFTRRRVLHENYLDALPIAVKGNVDAWDHAMGNYRVFLRQAPEGYWRRSSLARDIPLRGCDECFSTSTLCHLHPNDPANIKL